MESYREQLKKMQFSTENPRFEVTASQMEMLLMGWVYATDNVRYVYWNLKWYRVEVSTVTTLEKKEMNSPNTKKEVISIRNCYYLDSTDIPEELIWNTDMNLVTVEEAFRLIVKATINAVDPDHKPTEQEMMQHIQILIDNAKSGVLKIGKYGQQQSAPKSKEENAQAEGEQQAP